MSSLCQLYELTLLQFSFDICWSVLFWRVSAQHYWSQGDPSMLLSAHAVVNYQCINYHTSATVIYLPLLYLNLSTESWNLLTALPALE